MVTNLKKRPHYQELQTIRLAEVQAIKPEAWQELRQQMRQAQKLPKLNEHFRKHGDNFADLGVKTSDQYQAMFLEHVRRLDLEVFTYISTQKGKQYRQWALVGMDNGAVAFYNENKQAYWSFMRQSELESYLLSGRGWWLKVDDLAGKPRVRRW